MIHLLFKLFFAGSNSGSNNILHRNEGALMNNMGEKSKNAVKIVVIHCRQNEFLVISPNFCIFRI